MVTSALADAIETGEVVLPAYGGACIANVVPALLEHPMIGDGWMPDHVADADQVVLFVVDGLGWHQLGERAALAPTLSRAEGGPITSVAPSTTGAALTSISTGVPPGEHSVVGYRVRVAGETLNVLRWSTERGDARQRIPPLDLQPVPAFGNRSPVVVNKAEFRSSGFTQAHLDGSRFVPYGTPAVLVHEVAEAIRAGERFVYCYYDGLDRTGHERGHDAGFDAELAFVDRLVADLRSVLPEPCALVVTADHGQVDCGFETVELAAPVAALAHATSGEDRFLWLHARSEDTDALAAAARDHHGAQAHVLTVDEAIASGLFGPRVSSSARERLGEVALVARGRHAIVDPARAPLPLIGRHGGLTADEMLVPLLSVR